MSILYLRGYLASTSADKSGRVARSGVVDSELDGRLDLEVVPLQRRAHIRVAIMYNSTTTIVHTPTNTLIITTGRVP